jgi:hypothetical protein
VGPPVATLYGWVATPPPQSNGGGLAQPSRLGGGAGGGARASYGYNGGYNGHPEHPGEPRDHRGGGFYRGPVWSGWVDLNYPGYLGDGYPLGSGFDASGATAANAYGAGGAVDPYGPAGPPPDQTGAASGYPPAYSSASPSAFQGVPSGYATQTTPAEPATAQATPNAPVQGFRPQYQPRTEAAVAAAPEDEESVTLIFKDGRPSEHIHNYAMTRTTLYVQDKHHRAIPIAELDLPATIKANREAGVSFDVPKGGQ